MRLSLGSKSSSDNTMCLCVCAVQIGVAMGNASGAVKSVADAVVASNDEDGVAEAIDRFVLEPRRIISRRTQPVKV